LSDPKTARRGHTHFQGASSLELATCEIQSGVLIAGISFAKNNCPTETLLSRKSWYLLLDFPFFIGIAMNASGLPRFGSMPMEPAPMETEMVELAVLLPAWQAEALELAAQDRGLTTGQMIRSLIRGFCEPRNRLTNYTVGRDC
jgi:hypothetical protein